ncbi:DUF6185 family protein [Streptomyces sp. NPDC005373]|uniref:DUF6185 family protein n=1 Tax=Streptomyces sp. NPDC005373 TaxID=3156879 RepID=UPI0033B2DEFE
MVIRRRCSVPILLSVLLLSVFFVLTSAVISHAAEANQADSCGVDGLSGVKVTASAEFDHNGLDYSAVTSVMEIKIPAGWGRASDLLLDTHASRYRQVLRCLLGKVPEGEFYDYDEWRLKPLTVNADGKEVVVHYEAVAWVQDLNKYRVGPWILVSGKGVWDIHLAPPASLSKVVWEDVQVRTGGPRPVSVTPPSATGKDGTVLSWHNQKPTGFRVKFRPPAAQQWDAITVSQTDVREALGIFSGSSAADYVAAGALLLIAARRLRQGVGQHPADDEEKAFTTLRSWALLQVCLGLLVYMGDNVYYFISDRFSWFHDYSYTVGLLSLTFLGLVLCLFGKLQKSLLVVACVLVLAIVGISIGSEVAEYALLPVSEPELKISPTRSWFVVIAHAAAVFVFCMGAISAGRRALLMNGGGLPSWLVASISAGFSALTVLWAFLAFWRYWDRITWLADTGWSTYGDRLRESYDSWWWSFPSYVLSYLWDFVSLALIPLVLLGALRVCRAERKVESSFTPTQSEKFLLVVSFALVVLPSPQMYFGISGYILTLILGLFSAWALLSLAGTKAVLQQPSADDLPLGQVISLTDRSTLLRMGRHYRELQDRLHRPGSGNSAEPAVTHESIEREIDQLDQCLPEGVRPVDVAFAWGPMATWWANACRCAITACLVGLPATGLMYWIDMVRNSAWVVLTQDAGGFPSVVHETLYWNLTWAGGGFFLGALWRDLPGRNGPTKAFYVAIFFAIPVCVHWLFGELSGQSTQGVVATIAAFTSVMTITGLIMDVQTFQSDRRYWPTSASLIMYIYQMRFASVAFFLSQIVALATIWKALREGGPTQPPSPR